MISRVMRKVGSEGPDLSADDNRHQVAPERSNEISQEDRASLGARGSQHRAATANVSSVARLLHPTLTLENAFYEYYLGVSTRGLHGFTPGDWSQAERLYYQTIPYRMIFRILDWLALERSDVVVDLGCGKGRVLCCASLYELGQVIGVDVREELCETAERNLRRMRRKRAPSTIIRGKAEEFDYTRGTVFYMFHPFGPNTLKTVLLQLNRGVHENPRRVRIVYVNPRHDAVLEGTDWLVRDERWSSGIGPSRCVVYPVSFWSLRSFAGANAR